MIWEYGPDVENCESSSVLEAANIVVPVLLSMEGYAVPRILLIFPGSVSWTGFTERRTGQVKSTSPPPAGAMPRFSTYRQDHQHSPTASMHVAHAFILRDLNCIASSAHAFTKFIRFKKDFVWHTLLTDLYFQTVSINPKLLHQRNSSDLQKIHLENREHEHFIW